MRSTLQMEPDRTVHTRIAGRRTPSRLRRFGAAVGRGAYRFLLPLLTGAAVVGLWQWAVVHFEVRKIHSPAPWDIWLMLGEQAEVLAEGSWVTVFETVVGFGIGAAGGLIMAVLFASSSVLERATLPLVIALNAIPKVAVAPLLAVWLGFGHPPKVTLAALICFFPIMIATMAGLMSTPAELHELSQSLSAPWWKEFFKIRVPWAMPQVFVGLKLGITLAVIGTVVAQLSRPDGGLGATIYNSSQSANTTLAFAAIVLLMVISLVLFYGVVALERVLLPWARATTATRG